MVFLFDVDNTLTPARQFIAADIKDYLKHLKSLNIPLAVVSGSDIVKIVEQVGSSRDEALSMFDYIFSENGLVSYAGHTPLPVESINSALGEERLQELINFCLHYISTVKLPVKRGTFIEFRKGMLNVSPIGRSCSQAERDQFVKYEQSVENVREKFVNALREKFPDSGLTFSLGGQISIDIFPEGWDKTYCLRHLQGKYESIHFFGDKTMQGGNDYEIFSHPATIGYKVECPAHTLQTLKELAPTLTEK